MTTKIPFRPLKDGGRNPACSGHTPAEPCGHELPPLRQEQTHRILSSKVYLYLTEFFAGMSVMAVELGASRLLAPYFSSSQIVWTIIIGTIMIAMALGSIYGGRMADRDPNPDRLYRRILIAAVWIALIPVLGKYLIVGISAVLIFSINTGFLVLSAFAACMLLFVFPLFLLGTVTPSLVKYTVGSLDDSGRIVGTLSAANTIGSIIGTFIPTFISIPAVGTAATFLIFAGILLVLALLYFLSGIRPGKAINAGAVISTVLFLACCVLGHKSHFAFWLDHLKLEDESIYNYLQVYETDRDIVLSTNALFGVQSIRRKDGSLTGMYYDYCMAAPYMAGLHTGGRPLNVLVLGMGSGTFASQCDRYLGEMRIEGVEIDKKITDLAYDCFALPSHINVTTYDGRAYLAALPEDRVYDVILVDAYQDITIPFQMSTVEFFLLVKKHLTPDGVMVVNMNMRGAGKGSINESISDTIRTVFPAVYTAEVRGFTNRVLYAGSADLLQRFHENLAMEDKEELSRLMKQVDASLVPYDGGSYVMTDDKAPVELLSMKAIDGLIKGEALYYRELYKEKGLKGLLEVLSS